MRTAALFFLLLATVLAPSCKSPVDVTASTSTYRYDPAVIDSASIQGSVLVLHLSHGGGCGNHEFALLSSGTFLESNPVQVPMALAHDANGDLCRALLSTTQRFSLEVLRLQFLTNYPQGGPAILRIRAPGPAGLTTSVRYDVR